MRLGQGYAVRVRKGRRRRKGPSLGARICATATWAVILVWVIFTLFPLYWTVITSFKTPLAVNLGPFYVPWVDFRPTVEPWISIVTRDFGGSQVWYPLLNSFVIGTSSAVLAVLVGTMAGYGLSRFQYRLARLTNKDIAFWILSQRILPPIATAIPFFLILRTLRLLDTRTGLIVVYTMFNLPFSVWLMRDFFNGLPKELEECAQVDGCTVLGAFLRIALPLSLSGLAATFVLCLIFSWNEFLFALILTFSKAQTMPLLIAGQNFQRGPEWWGISALAILTVLPVAVLAGLAQRQIIRGLTLGALKE